MTAIGRIQPLKRANNKNIEYFIIILRIKMLTQDALALSHFPMNLTTIHQRRFYEKLRIVELRVVASCPHYYYFCDRVS